MIQEMHLISAERNGLGWVCIKMRHPKLIPLRRLGQNCDERLSRRKRHQIA